MIVNIFLILGIVLILISGFFYALFYSLGFFITIHLPKDRLTENVKNYKGKVSVILATRNEEKNMSEVLASLLGQDFSDFSLIITDRSNDKTKEVAENFITQNAGKFSRKKVRTKILSWNPNTGYSPTKAGQLRWAIDNLPENTEIIVFVDADVFYPPNWLSSLLFPLTKGYDVVSSDMKLRKVETIREKMEAIDTKMMATMTHGGLFFRGLMVGGGCVFPKSVFDAVNGYEGIDHAVVEDVALANKFYKKGFKFGIIRDPKSAMHIQPAENIFDQKIRWYSSIWQETQFFIAFLFIGATLIPLLFYILGGLSFLLAILEIFQSSTFNGFYLEVLQAIFIVFLLDLIFSIHMTLRARINPIYGFPYFLWFNLTFRLSVIFAFFKKNHKWKEDIIKIQKITS